MSKTWGIVITILLVLQIVGAGTVSYAVLHRPPAANPPLQARAEGDTNFTNVVASGDVSAGDDLTVGDDAAVSGNLTVSGAMITAGAVFTATDDGTLPATAGAVLLTAEGAVGLGAIDTGSAGQVVYLVNSVDQTITITDTGHLKLGGNRALGQYDTLALICVDGTEWAELAFVNN